LRPQAVVGEAIGGNLNLIPAIGVYAALLREAGRPLSFPGGAPSIFEMVDADPLARSMEWAAIVKKNNLVAPADLHAFVGESFHFADAYFAYGTTARPILVSTIKVRQTGFHECMDSADMLRKWFRIFQELHFLPPLR
jgi:hypothetical protein